MKNINFRRIITWIKMMIGLSIKHVSQGIGKCYSKEDIKGYYNDLTLKIIKMSKKNRHILPILVHDDGSHVEFPIQIFQHGLAAYDLFLLTHENKFYETFLLTVDWAIKKQNKNGSWNTFDYIYPNTPYSSMAQGEGASLLVRAYYHTKNETYRVAVDKAISFMLLSIEKGGTARYENGDIYLHEFTHKSVVLNGWLFSIFGLLDYYKLSKNIEIKNTLDITVNTLLKNLDKFVLDDWSYYNLDQSIISSKFYHNLHIALLTVYSDLFDIKEVNEILSKWELNYNLKTRIKYFILKVKQKLKEE